MNEKLQLKKAGLKSFLKSFTLYQKIYLLSVLALTTAFVIFFPEIMLDEDTRALGTFVVVFAIIDTIANPLCELLISKQSKWNFIIDIVFIEVSALVIAIASGWYVQVATILLFWVPVDVISFVRWNKHPDDEDENLTKVKRLKWWQSVLLGLGVVAFGLIVGYISTNIPGSNEEFFDSFSSAAGIVNGVLLLLRYSEQWIAWLITTILYLCMDIKSGNYVLCITEVAMLVNTVYGMVRWVIYTKKHPNVK